MDNSLMGKMAVIGGTVVLCVVVICLTLIAILKDGNDEGIIVTALVGIPTLVITAGGPLFGHYLASQGLKSNPPTPPQSGG